MTLRPLLSLSALLLVPTLALTAADGVAPAPAAPPAPKLKPVQNAPVAVASTAYLIDTAIPAYGAPNQVPYYTDSRARVLYLEIHQYLADVESRVMAGEGTTLSVDRKGQAAPANDDARIKELLGQLTALDQTVAYRNYLEQWHLDNSYADLGCAAELLRLRGDVAAATVDKVKATKPVEPKAAEAKKPAPAPEKKKAVPAPAAPAPTAPAPAAPAPEAPAPTPAPEAPAAPAPAPEAPAPAAEAPAAEAPAAPPAEAPAAPPAEAPAAEAPAAEAPPAEAPAAEAPPAEAPPAQ